jgi:hypothetical protein
MRLRCSTFSFSFNCFFVGVLTMKGNLLRP